MSTTHYPGCRCCGQSGSGSSGSGDGPGPGSGSGSQSGSSGSGYLDPCCAGYYLPRVAYLTFGGALSFIGTITLTPLTGGDPAVAGWVKTEVPWCYPTVIGFRVLCADTQAFPLPPDRRWELIGTGPGGGVPYVPSGMAHCYGTLLSCSPLLITFACKVTTSCGTDPPHLEDFTAVLSETPP